MDVFHTNARFNQLRASVTIIRDGGLACQAANNGLAFWPRRDKLSRISNFATRRITKYTTATTMPPRVKRKTQPQQEVAIVADLASPESENAFEELAKKHWLKTTKKQTKVKVKPEVLKTEIWDVLEKEDFEFRSLLALENLQILEKYEHSLHASLPKLISVTDTYGLVITTILQISTYC